MELTLDALLASEPAARLELLREAAIAASRSAPLAQTDCEELIERAILEERHAEEVWSRLLRAAALIDHEQLSEAAGELTLTRALSERHALHEAHIVTLWRLGGIWLRVGDMESARQVTSRGLALARQHGFMLFEAIMLVNMAFVWGVEGEPQHYHALSAQALALFDQLGAKDRKAHTLCNMGGALTRMGELERAQQTYEAARALLDELPQGAYLDALITGGLGEIAFKRGLPDAESLIRAAAAKLRAINAHYDALRQEGMLVAALTEASQTQRAVALAEQVVDQCEARGYRVILAQALANLADALAAAARHCEAFDVLKRAELLNKTLRAEEARQRFAILRDAQLAQDLAHQRIQAHDLANINQQLRELLAERDRLNTQLARLASTDPLTQLPNRLGFTDAARQAFALSRGPFHLLLIDLNGFKAINDTWGHHAGDLVLIAVAQRLAANLSDAEPRGRLGGDEFLAILHADDDLARTRTAILQAAICQPLALPTTTVSPRMSLGMTPLSSFDALEQAIRDADALMYQKKREG